MQNAYWDEYLPMALECGMSPTQFWKGEPRLLNSYIRKHELELDEYNYKSWLSNCYSYISIQTALAQVLGNKNAKYLEKPIEEFYINKRDIEEDVSKENMQDNYRRKVNYWAKFGKKGGKN